MIGPENSHHSLTQQVASLEPITTLSLAFNFLRFGQFGCFYSEFSWALKGNFLTSDGRCDDFGFGFTARALLRSVISVEIHASSRGKSDEN